MKNLFTKIRQFAIAHKVWSVIIAIILVFGIWKIVNIATSTAGETEYITTTVTKGTIISSITASGQVEASNQIDLKAKNTGEITYVAVRAGDVVKKGKMLFAVDARDAEKAVRDAELNLESAKLSLQSTMNKTANSKEDLQIAVTDTYQDLLNSSLEALPFDSQTNDQTAPTISGNYTLGKEGDIVIETYASGGENGISFKTSGLIPWYAAVVSSTTSQPLSDSGLFIKFANTTSTQLGKKWIIHIPNKKGSSYISNYNLYQSAVRDLEKSKNQTDLTATDVASSELTVRQKENALIDAKNALRDYYVVAPFDGMIASVIGKVGDKALAVFGSIITNQKIALLSMNEVDVSKIKLGEKANITFDAIEDLIMTGEVAEIDTVGTVSQGVVSYNVKVLFDTNDNQVKPSMSVSAEITTNSKTNVLIVPSSAVKTTGNAHYVQVFATPLSIPATGLQGTLSKTAPEKIPVKIGISDDTNTEIISGIKEGDQVVSRTITSTANASATAPSLFGTSGGNRTGSTPRAIVR